MNFEEFLQPRKEEMSGQGQPSSSEEETTIETMDEVAESVELDVQKAVVESLAAEKAEQDEHISCLRSENARLKAEIVSLKSSVETLKGELAKLSEALLKNVETPGSNKVALLDREVELQDRFPGETRDHVLETIKAGRDQAEKEGYLRKAQLLESVLVANEPDGTLEKKRLELTKLFSENANILSGPVIDGLDKLGISYKNGEEYLLPTEIIKRNY